MGISSVLDNLARGSHSFSVDLGELAGKLGVTQAQAFSLVSGAFSTWDCEERHLSGEAWAEFYGAIFDGKKGIKITLVRAAGAGDPPLGHEPEKHSEDQKSAVKRRGHK